MSFSDWTRTVPESMTAATVATVATVASIPASSVASVAGVAGIRKTVKVAPASVPARPPDPSAEARRQRVLAMLDENPAARYAVLTHDTGDAEAVILTLAIRGRATCELRIPRDRYDPFLLLDLIERHGGTVH